VRHGVDGSRVETEGYGEQFPVANNATAEGRQQNRRVEIVVGKTDGGEILDRTTMR
jgi:outer membrane protein OmpA-like peptidoglycan-associated protein